MRTEMGNSALMLYLGLSWVEFDQLAAALPYDRLEVYRTLDEVSPNLEQLATKLNRPPEADMESDCELEAASRRAFDRLEEAVRVNEAFRQARSNSSLRARQGRRSDPLCREEIEAFDRGAIAAWDRDGKIIIGK